MNQGFEASRAARLAAGTHLPRWRELPAIELYIDQMVGYINQVYAGLTAEAELPLTKSMVNNYVKQKILPAPANKRYQTRHLAMLMLLYPLKKVFSLPECVRLLGTLGPGGLTAERYDAACALFERALRGAFGGREDECPDPALMPVWRATQVCAGKLYLQKYMEYTGAENAVPPGKKTAGKTAGARVSR